MVQQLSLIFFLICWSLNVSGQHGAGPDGILSNYTIISKNMSRPKWYNDALSSANVQSEDGAISIVLNDGAIWAYGDVILTTGHWLSNAALRIWTKKLSNGTIVVEKAKFSTSSNGTARQIIPYIQPENFSTYFIWPISGDWNSQYMNISYLNCEIGLRGGFQNNNQDPIPKHRKIKQNSIGTNSSFVAMPSSFTDCCESNYTDFYNMTWNRIYPAWNDNGTNNPLSPDWVLLNDQYLYQYYLREEFLCFDILIGRINANDYKLNNYIIEYPVFNESNYEQIIEWKKCQDIPCDIWNTLPSILKGRNNNVGAQISITWSELLQQYVMLGFDGDFGEMITLRSSKYPWGEWSKAYNVLNVTDVNDTNNWGYCPYIHPEFNTQDSMIFTWAMSDTGFNGLSYFGSLQLKANQ